MTWFTLAMTVCSVLAPAQSRRPGIFLPIKISRRIWLLSPPLSTSGRLFLGMLGLCIFRLLQLVTANLWRDWPPGLVSFQALQALQPRPRNPGNAALVTARITIIMTRQIVRDADECIS